MVYGEMTHFSFDHMTWLEHYIMEFQLKGMKYYVMIKEHKTWTIVKFNNSVHIRLHLSYWCLNVYPNCF